MPDKIVILRRQEDHDNKSLPPKQDRAKGAKRHRNKRNYRSRLLCEVARARSERRNGRLKRSPSDRQAKVQANRTHGGPETMAAWWTAPTSKHAFVLSWISVVLTLAASITGIALFVVSGSALCLVFGLENSVDLFSSIVVLWRFYCPGSATKEREDLLLKREKRASLAISAILLLLGFCVSITALHDLSDGSAGESTELDFNYIWSLSAVSIVLFGGLTIVKFRYAALLTSASLYKDALCSSIGTVLAIALLFNTILVEVTPTLWWLDPFVALVCGIGSGVLGAHALFVARFKQGLPIFTWKWWIASQGDGRDELGMRTLEPADFGDDEDQPGPSPSSNVEMSVKSNRTNETTESEVV